METDTHTQKATTTESFLIWDLVGNLLHMFKSKVTDMLRKVSCFMSVFTFQWQINLSKLKFVQHCNVEKSFSTTSTVSLRFNGIICWGNMPKVILRHNYLRAKGGGVPSKWLTSYLRCPSVIQVPRNITGGLSMH